MEDACAGVLGTEGGCREGTEDACEDVLRTEGVADREGSEGTVETVEDINSTIVTGDAGKDIKAKDCGNGDDFECDGKTENWESKSSHDNKCEKIDITMDVAHN